MLINKSTSGVVTRLEFLVIGIVYSFLHHSMDGIVCIVIFEQTGAHQLCERVLEILRLDKVDGQGFPICIDNSGVLLEVGEDWFQCPLFYW